MISKERVLLFCPKTFNYEKEIELALQRRGAEVTYLKDRPWNSALLKGLCRLFPRVAWIIADVYYSKWMEVSAPTAVDVVLVVKGEAVSPRTLRRLRARYPSARFVLYLWDSVSNVRRVETKFGIFDDLFSFDSTDCQVYERLRYRPLFYLEQYRKRSAGVSAGAGCFFLGTLNGNRPKVLWRLELALDGISTLDYWLFVRSGLELRLRMLFDRSLRRLDPKRLIRRPLTSTDIAGRLAAAAAVVDIEHPRQAGLTMRTFEVLASGRKLITTNRRIQNEEFYHPSRILVIDHDCPNVPEGFLCSEFSPLGESFFARYSIDGWISDVLSNHAAH
jgi:hypothetical protein